MNIDDILTTARGTWGNLARQARDNIEGKPVDDAELKKNSVI